MFILGIIPARGGSKQVPAKNLRQLAGKPLIAHTIETAVSSELLSGLCVTTDSEYILAIAESHGVEHTIKRPPEMATDSAPIVPAFRHAVRTYEENSGTTVDAVAVLFPTLPLRTKEDLDGALKTFVAGQPANCLTTVHEVDSRTLYYLCRAKEGRVHSVMGEWPPSPNRQDFEPLYLMDGAIEVCTRTHIFSSDTVQDNSSLYYEIPSNRSLDIDSEADWLLAEEHFAMRNK